MCGWIARTATSPRKSTLTTQQIEMWMPTATEARKVIVSAGNSMPGGESVGTG